MSKYDYYQETLFGMAPFASKTFEELEEKVLDVSPVKVHTYVHTSMCVCVCMYTVLNPVLKIPDDCGLSDDCRDLLMRLLERDQNNRISFQEFFSHPFIDLEHLPGPACLEKAVRITPIRTCTHT